MFQGWCNPLPKEPFNYQTDVSRPFLYAFVKMEKNKNALELLI